jgi:hypothetical protein
MDDKLALRLSQAGMRFIAQMTIYNSGAFDRLHTFVAESYHPDLLELQTPEEWLATLREWYQILGRVRVRQVVGMGKHHVIVLLETQHGEGYFLSEMKVEEDYPHRITAYSTSPLE